MPRNKGAHRAERELRLHAPSRKLEVRKNDDGSRTIAGEAVVYNSLSEDMGFREIIKPGAFTQSLKSNPDLLLLYGHDDNKVCARVSNSSLRIEDTPTALRFTAKLPDVSWANDLVTLLESDLVGGMSFGFICLEDEWTDTGSYLLRSVIAAEIFEISVVPSWPAYKATSVSLRTVPATLRAKLTKRDSDDSDDATEDDDDSCDCVCPDCEDSRCEDCSADSCDDPNCEECPAQAETETLRLRLRLAQTRARINHISKQEKDTSND